MNFITHFCCISFCCLSKFGKFSLNFTKSLFYFFIRYGHHGVKQKCRLVVAFGIEQYILMDAATRHQLPELECFGHVGVTLLVGNLYG